MKYLQIPDDQLRIQPELTDLIWPQDQTQSEYCYIWNHSMHLVPEDHANIAWILLRLPQAQWYDEATGPFMIVRDWRWTQNKAPIAGALN